MKRNKTKNNKLTAPFPSLERQVKQFLTSEEAKISTKNLVKGSLVLFCLGMASEQVLATHNSHASYGTTHDSWGGHGSGSTHANSDSGHTSANPHHSVAPHSSDGSLGVAHVSGHASGGLSEATTQGALHNDATAGYGKHSAGTGHYNLPLLVNNTIDTSGAGHASTVPHYSTAPHYSTGHTTTVANHNDYAQHYSMHANGADGHGSHGSHGQW